MDYSKNDNNKDTDAKQINISNCIQEPNRNINFIEDYTSNQIHKLDNSEQQRAFNEHNSCAKNEHPLRSFSMSHKKQHSEPNGHKQQITPLSSKYIEVVCFNEIHDAPLNKIRDEMQKECSILSIAKTFSENMLDNKNKISNSNLKEMTKFKMALITDANTAEELMQNKPVNEEKEYNAKRLNDSAKFQKSREPNRLNSLHRNECSIMDDNKSKTSIVCSNQVLRPESSDIVDEKEITENVAKGRNESSEKNNHMTKKQLQILMSRSCAEPNGNGLLENNVINDQDHGPVKTQIHEVNIDSIHDANFFETPNISGKINKSNHLINDNCALITTAIEAESISDKFDVKTPDKIRFEEIENKLEEMFAGIEDEQLVQPTSCKSNTNNTSSNKVGDDFQLDETTLHAVTKESSGINKNTRDEVVIPNFCNENELLLPINSLHPSKGAKKSTESRTLKTNNIVSEKNEFTTEVDAQKLKKTMPTHRRLSIAMDPALLRFSKQQNHKESDNNRNKIKTNNKNRYVEKNKEKKYSKSLISNNKRKQFKSESQATTKLKPQNLKHRRLHTLSLDNDNDQEERTQQVRELDNKIRSPFILVKHNGTISVVNSPTIDDLNEKNTKSKKTGTFVHERKKVRGCHSSTLSNRYDADTADSSWICVFCKHGPHKKGLGDLFGPYIVSIDCEEYQSAVELYTHDSASLFIKRRRIESSILTEKIQGIHTKCTNETVIQTHMSETQDMSDCNEEPSFHKFSLGMSRISDIGYEIWLHEDCAIWAPNLFVIGSRLVGLEAAIWNSTRYKCVFCSKPGAILCCLQRECKVTAHVPCARESNWSLDEQTFWSHCKNHVSTSSPN